MTRGSVLAIIGVGGMGVAIARRLGSGRRLAIGDADKERLRVCIEELSSDGYDVGGQFIDVGSRESVEAFGTFATSRGPVSSLVHTAGVSAAEAPVDAILRIDLLGTALVLEAFEERIEPGGAAVVIASMAGHMIETLTHEEKLQLAHTPAAELLELPFLGPAAIGDNGGWAYAVAKQANVIRVQAAASRWGRRGVRVNSISPGIISTAMGRREMASAHGAAMTKLIEDSALKRHGTAEEIAAVVEFLLDSRSSFVTGTDLLVDGGVIASLRSAVS